MPKTFSNGFLSRAETRAGKAYARPASNVDDHSYDPATRELTVTFSHGPTRCQACGSTEPLRYKYFDVTQSQANALASAKSRGEFLHKHIIGKNDAERLSD